MLLPDEKNKYHKAYGAILYSETESYDIDSVLAAWRDYFVDWAYIYHDKDKLEDGSLKKPHYHIYGRCRSSALVSTVSNKIGVTENYFETIKTTKGFIRYFAHFDDPDKYQYGYKNIVSSFDVTRYFESGRSQIVQAQMLKDYIQSDLCKSYGDLVQFALDSECWSELRRGASLFNSLMRESVSFNRKNMKGEES